MDGARVLAIRGFNSCHKQAQRLLNSFALAAAERLEPCGLDALGVHRRDGRRVRCAER